MENKAGSNLKAPLPCPPGLSHVNQMYFPQSTYHVCSYLAHDLFTWLWPVPPGNEAPGPQTQSSPLIATAPGPKIVLGT